MSDPQGLIDFPGLTTFDKFEYCATQGITPGKAVIEMPQELLDDLERFGDLTISYDEEEVTLTDCIVDEAHIDRSQGGFIARVTLLDRRWRWAFGYINGHFNLRMPSGSCADEGLNSQAVQTQGDVTKILSGTERDPQSLATACLEAMGESGYDVSVIPNSARPEIHWSMANPAKSLQDLCESLGCRITLDLDSDSVVIVTIGQGEPLPDNGLQQWVSEGMNPPETPSALLMVGGPTVFQGMLPLEAVGVDLDGSIKPIDDLSYKPLPNGWFDQDPGYYPSITDPLAKALAEDSLYRMWRIDPTSITVPTTGMVTDFDGNILDEINVVSINQILLYDRMIDTHNTDSDPAKIVGKKPELWGDYYPKYRQQRLHPTQMIPYRDFIQVDVARNLIYTGDRLFKYDQSSYLTPQLFVKIAYSIRDPDTLEPYRYVVQRQLDPESDSPPRVVHHEEIFLKVTGSFDDSFTLQSTSDNAIQDNIQQEAAYYLDAVESEYIEQDSFDIPYVGIVPIQVDGLIQQVTFTIESGPNGKTVTRASLATEHNPYVLPYKRAVQARETEELRQNEKRAKAYESKHRGSSAFGPGF